MRRFVYRRLVFGSPDHVGDNRRGLQPFEGPGPDPILMFVRDDGYGIAPLTIENLRAKWGLDKPIPVQYVVWMGRILRGDLGKSLNGEKPVRESIQARMGATVQLAIVGWGPGHAGRDTPWECSRRSRGHRSSITSAGPLRW